MFWEDVRDFIVVALLIILGTMISMVAIFGVIYGLMAWADSGWECPPGTFVVYGDLGFKSACYSVPNVPIRVN